MFFSVTNYSLTITLILSNKLCRPVDPTGKPSVRPSKPGLSPHRFEAGPVMITMHLSLRNIFFNYFISSITFAKSQLFSTDNYFSLFLMFCMIFFYSKQIYEVPTSLSVTDCDACNKIVKSCPHNTEHGSSLMEWNTRRVITCQLLDPE